MNTETVVMESKVPYRLSIDVIGNVQSTLPITLINYKLNNLTSLPQILIQINNLITFAACILMAK